MQQNFPKAKGVLDQLKEPHKIELTYENLCKYLYKLYHGIEIPEEELQKMLKEHRERKLKLTD